MDVLLDGGLMVNREALHDQLAKKLKLPEYYGRNLDALYDLLTQFRCPRVIRLICVSAVRENLGAYGSAFINTMEDAARNNPALTVNFFDNFPDNEK